MKVVRLYHSEASSSVTLQGGKQSRRIVLPMSGVDDNSNYVLPELLDDEHTPAADDPLTQTRLQQLAHELAEDLRKQETDFPGLIRPVPGLSEKEVFSEVDIEI